MKVELLPGALAKTLVDPFYAEHGKDAHARDHDIFFLALEEKQLLGVVRFCVENDVPMLRTMLVHKDHRARGTGALILQSFTQFLQRENVTECFLVAYDHLEHFYGDGGFVKIPADETPPFLLVRIAEYGAKGLRCICMRRRASV